MSQLNYEQLSVETQTELGKNGTVCGDGITS